MGRRRSYDREAVRAFAAAHTTEEIAAEFGFLNRCRAGAYCAINGIPFVRQRGGRQAPEPERKMERAQEPEPEPEQKPEQKPERKRTPAQDRKPEDAAPPFRNEVMDWFVRNGDCSLCNDMGWEAQCSKSGKPCEQFLERKLRKYFSNRAAGI